MAIYMYMLLIYLSRTQTHTRSSGWITSPLREKCTLNYTVSDNAYVRLGLDTRLINTIIYNYKYNYNYNYNYNYIYITWVKSRIFSSVVRSRPLVAYSSAAEFKKKIGILGDVWYKDPNTLHHIPSITSCILRFESVKPRVGFVRDWLTKRYLTCQDLRLQYIISQG